MNERMKTTCRLSIVACLVLGGHVSSRAEAEATGVSLPRDSVIRGSGALAASSPTKLPPLLRPVTLKDAEGKAERDLVDPFRRRDAEDDVATTPGEDGLMRTTMGEISSEFRILAITIPQDTNTPRAALIQFYNADEPILVHEGDLVRVDRFGANRRGGRMGRAALQRSRASTNGRTAPFRPQAAASSKPPLQNDDLEEQLRKFVFYVNVKHIDSTFIEVYHNKKRPDETIRLNW